MTAVARRRVPDFVFFLAYAIGVYAVLLAPLNDAVTAFVPVVFARPPLALRCVAAFVTADFAAYWIHRAAHAVPLLWFFHRTHHTTTLGPLTTFRFHIMELAWRLAVAAAALRLFNVGAWSVPALFVYAPLLLEIVAHSDLPWTYGPFRIVLVSPAHHSRHHDRDSNVNYAMLLAFWDFAFATVGRQTELTPDIEITSDRSC